MRTAPRDGPGSPPGEPGPRRVPGPSGSTDAWPAAYTYDSEIRSGSVLLDDRSPAALRRCGLDPLAGRAAGRRPPASNAAASNGSSVRRRPARSAGAGRRVVAARARRPAMRPSGVAARGQAARRVRADAQRRSAARRSSPVSTSCRTEARPRRDDLHGARRQVPVPGAHRRRRGRVPAPGVAVSSVVPIPAASARNARRGTSGRPSRAPVPVRRGAAPAGRRSAPRPPRPGDAARTAAAPCVSAAFSPPPGASGTTTRAQRRQLARRQRVVRDHHHIPHRPGRPAPRSRCPGRRRAPVRAAAPRPAAPASLLLARTSGFSGTTRRPAALVAPLLRLCRIGTILTGCRRCAGASGLRCSRQSGYRGDTVRAATEQLASQEEGVPVSRRRIGFWYRLAAVICETAAAGAVQAGLARNGAHSGRRRIYHRGQPQLVSRPALLRALSSTTAGGFRDSWPRRACSSSGFVGP